MLHYCLAVLPSGFYSTWLLFYQLSSVDACWLGFCLFGFCCEGDVFVVLRYLQHFVKFYLVLQAHFAQLSPVASLNYILSIQHQSYQSSS